MPKFICLTDACTDGPVWLNGEAITSIRPRIKEAGSCIKQGSSVDIVHEHPEEIMTLLEPSRVWELRAYCAFCGGAHAYSACPARIRTENAPTESSAERCEKPSE